MIGVWPQKCNKYFFLLNIRDFDSHLSLNAIYIRFATMFVVSDASDAMKQHFYGQSGPLLQRTFGQIEN